MIQTKEREKLGTLLALIFKLQDETSFPDQKQRQEALNKLTLYAQQIGVSIDPNDPEFLPTLMIKILEESSQSIELPPGNLPPQELIEIYEKEKQEKETKMQKAMASPNAYRDYQNYIDSFKKWILNKKYNLPPELAEAIAESAAKKTITSVLPPGFLSEEDKEQVLKKAEEIIDNELRKISEESVIKEAEEIVSKEAEKIKKEQEAAINEVKKNIKTGSIKIAVQPAIFEATKGEILPPKEEALVLKELPPEIIQKLNQATQVEGYSPAYTLFHPKAIRTLIQRTFYTILAKIVQTTAPEASVEFQKMAQGLFAEDFRETANRLRSWGLDEKHPIFQYLKNQADRFEELQKTIPIKNRRGDIIGYGKSRDITILERYFNYVKSTGKWQGSIDYGGQKINLLSSVRRLWDEGGYGLSLKQSIGRFRFTSKIYQKVFRFISRGKYDSLGAWTQKFVYGKVLKPILIKLGKTAAGQAVKAGVKKAAGWLATKAGIKLGIWAAGAATAVPSAGVSLLIAAAVEIGTRLLGKIWDKVKTIIRDPEKALMAIGAGILALVFIPMPFALIAILPLTIGGLGLMTFIAAPATLGAIGGGISGFFIAIAAPIAAPIALFVIILFSVLAILTLFIVLVVSGAFILPSKVAEVTPTTISPYVSEYFEISKNADPNKNKLDNSQVEDGETIKYTITIKAKGNYVLSVVSLEENFTVFKEGASPLINDSNCQFTPKKVQEAIDNSQSLECSINIDSRFKDSAISNTVTLKTGVKDNTGEPITGIHMGAASAMIIIGNPPMKCPSGWPINPNEASEAYISQGPTTSGPRASHQGQEAIDISVYNGRPVHATHEGYVIAVKTTSCGGKEINIEGICEGLKFTSKYLHLKSISVSVGQTITPNFIIGESDDTGGCSTGAHLHYEFKGLKMQPRYIPRDVRYCIGDCGEL